MLKIVLLWLSLLPVTVGTVQAEQAIKPLSNPTAPQAQRTPPPVEKIAPGKYRLRSIVVDTSARSLEFPALVNMDRGLLEYLIVNSRGKTHESLLRTEVQPYDLQFAFMLLGYRMTSKPLEMQGALDKPTGEGIAILISTAADRERPFPAERWLATKVAPEAPLTASGRVDWVFTGSVVDLGRFMAQETGQIAAIYHDPVAMMDNASPGGESDKIWYVNEKSAAAIGTEVTVTIKPAKNGNGA